jgi:hypothetical protein
MILALPALILAITGSATVYANHHKLDVCHVDGNGTYTKINIAEKAFQAHLNHGDSIPGGLVPGSGDGYIFTADCTVIAACPCFADLPSDWNPDIGLSGNDYNYCYGNQSAWTIPYGFEIFTDSSTGIELEISYEETCNGPTLYECSVNGNPRDINQAQYEACDLSP